MKTDTRIAARELGLHPAELLVRLWNKKLVYTLEDCWPQIDQGLIETLSQVEGLPRRPPVSQPDPALDSSLSPLQMQIIHVMNKRKHWGHNRIGEDQLKKFLPQGTDSRNLHKALKKLHAQGLVLEQNNGYSLNTHKKADIDRYLRHPDG